MTVRNKLIAFVSIGFSLIFIALKMSSLSPNGRGALLIRGGWLMAIGGLYQIKLYADYKDILYYSMVVFVSIFWTCLTVITLYWLALLMGWA